MRTVVVIVTILSIGLAVNAQTQAPIEWGGGRWLGIGHGRLYNLIFLQGVPAALMGDTLVFVGDSVGQGRIPISCYSHDNGLTFSPWQPLDEQFWDSYYATVSGSAGRVFAFSTNVNDGLILRSLDGGLTWAVSRPPTLNMRPLFGLASGSQVLYLQGHWIENERYDEELVISNDGGEVWHAPVSLSDSAGVRPGPLCVTQGHIIVTTRATANGHACIAVTTADRWQPTFGPFQALTAHPEGGFQILGIAGDTCSETAIALTLTTGETGNLYVTRTADGGGTWQAPRALTTWSPINWQEAHPEIFCRGNLWGVVWQNQYDFDHSRWGVYLSFSANHGKDWYPDCALGFDFPCMGYSGGQFVNNEVRVHLHWNCGGQDYLTVTGVLTPDTSQPDVALDLVAPDTIRVGDTLRFFASASDNDTLSEVRVVLSDSAGLLPDVVLPRTAEGLYQGSFVVPHEGVYQYRGEAEDFWEYVGTDPDSGWLAFHTEGWSASDDFILPPSSFVLSVFPNPFNSATQIEFVLPVTQRVSLRLYDVLGREVAVLMEGIQSAGTHRVSFDGSNLSSGIYFARLDAAGASRMQKIVLLR